MKILMVLTSHSELGIHGEEDRILFLEEFAASYFVRSAMRARTSRWSPRRDSLHADPKSEEPRIADEENHRTLQARCRRARRHSQQP